MSFFLIRISRFVSLCSRQNDHISLRLILLCSNGYSTRCYNHATVSLCPTKARVKQYNN